MLFTSKIYEHQNDVLCVCVCKLLIGVVKIMLILSVRGIFFKRQRSVSGRRKEEEKTDRRIVTPWLIIRIKIRDECIREKVAWINKGNCVMLLKKYRLFRWCTRVRQVRFVAERSIQLQQYTVLMSYCFLSSICIKLYKLNK